MCLPILPLPKLKPKKLERIAWLFGYIANEIHFCAWRRKRQKKGYGINRREEKTLATKI
jgi:hypothetical protein